MYYNAKLDTFKIQIIINVLFVIHIVVIVLEIYLLIVCNATQVIIFIKAHAQIRARNIFMEIKLTIHVKVVMHIAVLVTVLLLAIALLVS